MLTLADNFLQKQQKQQDRRFGVDCGWWAGSGSPGAKLSHYPTARLLAFFLQKQEELVVAGA